jgi:hypothetical protein
VSEDKDRKDDFKITFGTAPGKRALKRLERMFDKPSYVPGDPHQTSYHEGRRAVYEFIKRQIEVGDTPDRIKEEPENA